MIAEQLVSSQWTITGYMNNIKIIPDNFEKIGLRHKMSSISSPKYDNFIKIQFYNFSSEVWLKKNTVHIHTAVLDKFYLALQLQYTSFKCYEHFSQIYCMHQIQY
jgi:hypothetical protein